MPSYFQRLIAPEGLPNLILCVVGIAGVIAAILTLRAGKRAVEIVISKERARLRVKLIHEGEWYDFSTAALLEEVTLEISQDGPTHAFNVFGQAKIIVTPTKTTQVFSKDVMKDMYRMGLPNFIAGNAIPAPVTVFVPSINQREIDDIQNERLFVHLFGVIAYEDVFGDSHKTKFRYLWVIDRHDENAHDSDWLLHGPEGDNRAT
jgi:hypothetical protein